MKFSSFVKHTISQPENNVMLPHIPHQMHPVQKHTMRVNLEQKISHFLQHSRRLSLRPVQLQKIYPVCRWGIHNITRIAESYQIN